MECGGTPEIWLYFYSFQVIVSMIFLNLFVAIILQGFSDINDKESQILNEGIVDNFRNTWSKYDPLGSGFIKASDIKSFLIDLGPPLGIPPEIVHDDRKENEFMGQLEIPTYDNLKHIFYYEVLLNLTKKKFLDHVSKAHLRKQVTKLDTNTSSLLPLSLLQHLRDELELKQDDEAVLQINKVKAAFKK